MRVYELARDLKLTSRELLAALAKMGIEVEDHASVVSDGDAEKVRQKLVKGPAAKRKAKAAPAPKPEGTSLGRSRRAPSTRPRHNSILMSYGGTAGNVSESGNREAYAGI